ncbi:hypothetical protein FQR65_LT03160 [Abscondita terminalis]|nr:hypothetical protein FQR65_LT03160 [Abscondita terminalis]
METEELEENTNELEERELIRKQISTMSFEDLQNLKEKIGSKEYNSVVFGTQKNIKKPSNFKRENKNRPRERSSKENQNRELKKQDTKKSENEQEKQEIRKKLKQGQKPMFVKKSEKRIQNLVHKYEELKKSNKLEKHLEKRYKKLASKDKKNFS